MKMYDRCLFILLDGARPDVIGNLLAQGSLPHFYRLFVERGIFTRAVTSFPSTTGPAYLPYLTGFYPGYCNVPGIRWFDRRHYAHHSSLSFKNFRSYIGPESYLFNSDISSRVQTLFERFQKSTNIFSTVSRGVKFSGEKTHVLRGLYALYARLTDDWLTIDRAIGLQTQWALREKPDFLFSVFPGIDELSHLTHPFSDPVMKAYHQFDQRLGKIMKRLDLEKTLVILASDHGLSATHTHFDLVGFLEDLGYHIFYYPKILKQNFDAVVMQSGNAMAHVYFKNGQGWEERSKVKDLEKVMDALSQRQEIAWVAALDEEKNVYIRSQDSDALIKKENEKIIYCCLSGDPLQMKGKNGPMTSQESLELSFYQKYPDAWVQLLQLFESCRTGDLVVTASLGHDLRSHFEWPEHRSSHGSLLQEHMHVPLALSHPFTLNRKIRSVDVYPTILKLLGIHQEKPCQGEALAA